MRRHGISLALGHLLVGWLVATAQAQTPACPTAVLPDTARGAFAVDLGDRFCAGLTVRLTTPPGLQNVQYWYEYGGSAVPTTGGTTLPTHLFANPGKYVIIQRAKQGTQGTYACKVVEVLPKPAPVFSVVSCTPGLVTLTIPPDPANGYDEYVVSWGLAGTQPQILTRSQTPLDYRYPSPSTNYNVIVTGRYQPSGCGNAAIQGIRASGQPPSVLKADLTRLELTGPTTALLTMTNFRGGEIEVFQRPPNGFFQTTHEKLTTSASVNTVTLKNLNNQNQYCFKAVLTDKCQRTQESDELCSLPLRATAQNQQNQVEWTAYPPPPASQPFRDYTLTRNGTPWGAALTNIATTQRTDAPVRCGDTYRYQVTARVGGMTSVSEAKPVRGVSTLTPPAVTQFQSSVLNGSVALSWVAPPAGTPPNDGIRKYTLTRSDDGGQTYQPLLDSTQAIRFDDKTAQPDARPYCYTLRSTDVCGNQSPPSTPTCTVWLQQNRDELVWTPYRQFTGTAYSVEEVGAAGAPQPVGTNLSFTPDPNTLSGQQVRYRIKVTGSGAGNVSYSNEILYSLTMRVFVPEVFTPNGDGINDAFEVKGLFIQDYKLSVFNRWGEPIFQTNDRREGWNGLFNGTPAPEGAYAYQLDVVDFRGNSFRKQGSVLLAR
jgi:gliding motility-associated-like protein